LAAELIPAFNSTYLSLLEAAAAAYGPGVSCFLTCGPMSDRYCNEMEWVAEEARKRGIKAHAFAQQPPSIQNSCCYHPGDGGHLALADITGAFIRERMGWPSEAEEARAKAGAEVKAKAKAEKEAKAKAKAEEAKAEEEKEAKAKAEKEEVNSKADEQEEAKVEAKNKAETNAKAKTVLAA